MLEGWIDLVSLGPRLVAPSPKRPRAIWPTHRRGLATALASAGIQLGRCPRVLAAPVATTPATASLRRVRGFTNIGVDESSSFERSPDTPHPARDASAEADRRSSLLCQARSRKIRWPTATQRKRGVATRFCAKSCRRCRYGLGESGRSCLGTRTRRIRRSCEVWSEDLVNAAVCRCRRAHGAHRPDSGTTLKAGFCQAPQVATALNAGVQHNILTVDELFDNRGSWLLPRLWSMILRPLSECQRTSPAVRAPAFALGPRDTSTAPNGP